MTLTTRIGILLTLLIPVMALTVLSTGAKNNQNNRERKAQPILTTAIPPETTDVIVETELKKLEEAADQWGGYEEGQPKWELDTWAPANAIDSALRCGLSGGEPYSNIHCYRNLGAAPNATTFELTMRFWYSPTATTLTPADEVAQALEFTMNKWENNNRYEIALQWMNIGSNVSEWRFWDPYQDEPWVELQIPGEIALGEWHTLTLQGDFIDDYAYYRSFSLDGVQHELGISVPTAHYPDWVDFTAIAVQADGNYAQDAYDLVIDEVQWNLSNMVTPDDIEIDGDFADWTNGIGNEYCQAQNGKRNTSVVCVAHNGEYQLYTLLGMPTRQFVAREKVVCAYWDVNSSIDRGIDYAFCSEPVSGSAQLSLYKCAGTSTVECADGTLWQTYPETVFRSAESSAFFNASQDYILVEASLPYKDIDLFDPADLITRVETLNAPIGR